jgi:hypothetical protein
MVQTGDVTIDTHVPLCQGGKRFIQVDNVVNAVTIGRGVTEMVADAAPGGTPPAPTIREVAATFDLAKAPDGCRVAQPRRGHGSTVSAHAGRAVSRAR